jgi:hypothetical protein
MSKETFEEWFYPQAKRAGEALGRDKVDAEWKGRPPILVEDAWNHQQKKIDELKKLTLDNQARYNGALETIKALEKKIDVLQTTLDGFKNTGMIGVSPYQFLEKIQDLEESLKLKTTNEVNASVNADCLEGCRVKLKRAKSKLTKAVEALRYIEINSDCMDDITYCVYAEKTLEEIEKGD